VFFEEDTSSELSNALGKSSLSLDESFGFAAQVGVDYHFKKNFMINASIRYIDIDTDATIKTAAGVVKTSVEIDPLVYTLAIGYRF
jgi:outer membrane protein